MYSEQLLQGIAIGFARQEIIGLRSLSTRSAGNEKSALTNPLHTNSLSVVAINHIEQRKRYAVLKLDMHKVHKPNLVDFKLHCQSLWLVTN